MARRPFLRVCRQGEEWIDVRVSGRVKTSIPVSAAGDRILLLHWGTSVEPRLQNVARVDAFGFVSWRLELPGDADHDCFVRLERAGNDLRAYTHSGRTVHFDSNGMVGNSELAKMTI